MATFDQIKNPSQLKGFIENAAPFFFSPKAMRFFGDTMRNYGIVKHKTKEGLIIELYRKKPVKNGLAGSTFWILKPGSIDTAVKYRGGLFD